MFCTGQVIDGVRSFDDHSDSRTNIIILQDTKWGRRSIHISDFISKVTGIGSLWNCDETGVAAMREIVARLDGYHGLMRSSWMKAVRVSDARKLLGFRKQHHWFELHSLRLALKSIGRYTILSVTVRDEWLWPVSAEVKHDQLCCYIWLKHTLDANRLF